MSYFHRPSETETLEEQETRNRAPGARLSDLGDRIARALGTFERGRFGPPSLVEGEDDRDGPDTEAYEVVAPGATSPYPETASPYAESEEDNPRFPVAPFGYSRAAVDACLIEVERELQALRARRPAPPPSINDELARLGEQTASILVTAHDQASQTTRRAQENADRCLADAADRARQMTADAQRRLRELDAETDAVWQERRRLIEDVRATAQALLSLAADALERFPEEEHPEEDARTVAWPAPAGQAQDPGAPDWPAPEDDPPAPGWSPPAA